MQIGPRHWRWVSTDSTGVPHGGPYGSVDWFADKARRHGLHLAWSRLRQCFALYTRRGPERVICQKLLARDDNYAAIPLNAEVLSLILNIWEWNSRLSKRTIEESMRQISADEKYRLAVERQKMFEELEKPIMDAAYLKTGQRTPNIMVLPKGPIAIRGRA